VPAQGGDVGDRVEGLLAQLRRQGGEHAAETGEELVRLLVEYYGAGLERVVEIVAAEDGQLVERLADDPLVESQLILHGLHPVGVDDRIERALDGVRPYLGSHAGGVAYLGLDDEGVAHLRLDGSCNGCPSSTVTVKLTIEEALLGTVPEVARVEVDGKAEPAKAMLQIGMRSGAAQLATVPPPNAAVWLHPSALELPADGFAGPVHLDGRAVLMCRLGETYFAYSDSCPSCGGSLLGDAGERQVLEGDVLGCGSCGAQYDVRLAGRAADRSGRRLNPLPLLDDTSGIRVALLPEAV
jgi:Fe-S cluster biogenesis protein NfuA/nitrite reductase/ring-hydroxylating ferredoxin subunit